MNEQEWLSSVDLDAMMDHLVRRNTDSGTIAGEKMGFLATPKQFDAFARNCCKFYGIKVNFDDFHSGEGDSCLQWAMAWTNRDLLDDDDFKVSKRMKQKGDVRANILREVVGNHFKLPTSSRVGVFGKPQCPKCQNGSQNVKIWQTENDWRCASCKHVWQFTGDWITPLVKQMVLTIEEEERFQDMPILADVLEEKGCTNQDVLHHLRGEERCLQWNKHYITQGQSKKPYFEGSSCVRCNTGWIPKRFPCVKGCWVLEMLKS